MDHSVCQALCDKHIAKLAEFLSVGHWKIKVKIGDCDDVSDTATCQRNSNYDIAAITIDPRKIDTEDYLLDVLFHELAHVVLAPFDLYRTYSYQGMQSGSIEDKREDFIWANSVEKAVINLERLWRRHLKAAYLAQFDIPTTQS